MMKKNSEEDDAVHNNYFVVTNSTDFVKKPTDSRSATSADNQDIRNNQNNNDNDIIFTNNNSEDNGVLNNNNTNCLVTSSKEQCSPGFLKNETSRSRDDITESGEESLHNNGHNCYSVALPDEQSLHIIHSTSSDSTSQLDDQHVQAPREISGGNRSNSIQTETALEFDTGKRSYFIREQNGSVVDSEYNESASPTAASTATINVTQETCELFPEYLGTLVRGKEVCGDTGVPFAKPDWLDEEKFRRGQRFALNHIFGVMYAELISLMILFAFKGGLEPLIYTGKSDTPFKAFKRYLSTVTRVKSWYEEDIWDVNSLAHKNFKVVRGMHDAVRKSMNSCSREKIAKCVTLEDEEGSRPIWTDLHEDIIDDFQSSCPFLKAPLRCPKEVYVNQFDMGLTQFGFAGLLLLYPKMFGIHRATNDDLDSFAHFWRTMGYLLGTEDRFNLCNGDLATVQQRCRDMIDYWVRPVLRSVSRDWVHMSRCLFKGIRYYVPGVSFEVLLMYLCRVLSIRATKLAASLNFWQYFFYFETIFMYSFTFRLPGMWALHNWLINLAIKGAQHLSPERLQRLEQRVYPYQTAAVHA